jgi:hypothetical protein
VCSLLCHIGRGNVPYMEFTPNIERRYTMEIQSVPRKTGPTH